MTESGGFITATTREMMLSRLQISADEMLQHVLFSPAQLGLPQDLLGVKEWPLVFHDLMPDVRFTRSASVFNLLQNGHQVHLLPGWIDCPLLQAPDPGLKELAGIDAPSMFAQCRRLLNRTELANVLYYALERLMREWRFHICNMQQHAEADSFVTTFPIARPRFDLITKNLFASSNGFEFSLPLVHHKKDDEMVHFWCNGKMPLRVSSGAPVPTDTAKA